MTKKHQDPGFKDPGFKDRTITPVDPAVSEYIQGLMDVHDDPVLIEMEELAREKNFPIVGRQVGAFLEVMALSIGAETVFELGSGFGYSAWWFTRAVGEGGTVVCTDGDEDNKKLAQGFLTRAGRWGTVDYRVGEAHEILEETEGLFDVVYNDVDKDGYPESWRIGRDKVRPGGLYIADNTLWSGRVAIDPTPKEKHTGWTEAIKEHNRMIAEDRDFDFFMNPTRDGVVVARRQARRQTRKKS